ncbi:DNA-binding SARP family transcriptional activator [Kibdelosporangium banguiense]|uniref:DNA-binding SARP family transcriptional activator n=1 Tax=Kibdelosporangium banguiense TaxID=1365924 RepID=A0ABS4TZB1_9PSEU|nr:BTAD domain-containing putative transcriptional regulator [Kibdelosporangium banguiense]MBP2329744.1 DNA-binding SARP family transcriptional activator [Kibdelosporangium banguiense]
MPDGIDIRVLGPVEVIGPCGAVVLHGGGERTLVARLGLSSGQTVSCAALIDVLWADAAPPTAMKTLRSYLARLRRRLREAGLVDLIDTQGPGYVLHAPRDAVDAVRFEILAADGREALASGEAQVAVEWLRAGLALWRGEALADCRAGPWQRAEVTRLGEVRLAATEDLLSAQLALGGHATAIGELEFLVSQHPFQERLWELLILALYRAGRQADALTAFQRARTTLIDELGIEPAPRLRQLETAILTADPKLDLPRKTSADDHAGVSSPHRPRIVPAQLPPTIAGFTGRTGQLGQLDAALAKDRTTPAAVVVSAIAGTAGIGKTTLALHWAHHIAHRFPDGQLYINLRGFDPQAPTDPGQALDGFLQALGVDPHAIPADRNAKAALYRSLLADRRMLIVLDNARDTEHVRPLLPASSTCMVIITSRNRLDSLAAREGAHRLILDLLSTDEAVALLTSRIDHQRVEAEPDAVAELIELCARLPLALSIVAACATNQPRLRLSQLVEQLRDERARLDVLDLGDADLNPRAVFSWSYRTLTSRAAGLFRLLGLCPGPDISLPAAANLAGIPTPQTRASLTELARAHLLDEHTPRRYRFHDLLRAYAAEQATQEETEQDQRAAVQRLLDYYLQTSSAADWHLDHYRDALVLATPRPGVTPGMIANHEQAVDWFTTERAALLAAVDHAARTGMDIHAWQLPWTLTTFLRRRGHWHDWAAIQQTALAAADRLGDRTAQAHAHRLLGTACTWLGHHAAALNHLRQALAIFRQLGEQIDQACTHYDLSFVYEKQGRYTEALTHTLHAWDLYRAAGHHAGQARALNHVGWCHARLGHYSQTLTYCDQALNLHRDLDDPNGEALTLDSLAYAHHHLGHHRQAITHYQQAVVLYRRLGNHYEEAATLHRLGDTHHASGNHPAARYTWQQALTILDRLGYPEADEVRTKLTRTNDRLPAAPPSHSTAEPPTI